MPRRSDWLPSLRAVITEARDESSRDELLALCMRLVSCEHAGALRNDGGVQFIVDALSVLLTRERPLAAKVRALPVLAGAFAATPSDDVRLDRLVQLTRSMIVYDMPMKSTDLAIGTAAFQVYACGERE
jgi:hypothetical protein